MATVAEPNTIQGMTIERGQEILVRRRNEVGILFQLSTLLADRGVNILGVSAGVCGEDCLIHLITDDNRKSKEVLAANNFAPEEGHVILVGLPHRPGMLKQVTKGLAQEGIDIRHVYAAATGEQDKCMLVFHSSSDEVALARLKEIWIGGAEGTNTPEDRQADRNADANMIAEGGPAY